MKYLLPILLLSIGFVSCERDEDPNRISVSDLYKDFKVMESLDSEGLDSIDFEQKQNTFFTAEFNKPIIWELSVTGDKSGAQKNISGFSNELNEVNAVWDGSTTKFPMFKSGESCSVELNFPAEDTTLVLDKSITIEKAKVDEGVIIADFENGNKYRDDWDWFFQSGVSFFNLKSTKNAAQGKYYYKMFGECDWDWLVGMIHIPDTGDISNVPGTNKEYKPFGLSSDPENLYFNVLLNVREENAVLLINFKEDDNMDGVYDADNEDEYTIWLEGLEPGWQLISRKYSDLTAGGENESTPKGNGMRNPESLKIIDVLLLANPTSGPTRVDMDYMIFTEDEPLKP
ncbi:MAG: hypothetical protein L7U70_00775 [Flavobacteriales bacterium]|nr:hypothetical protein [Flavobacteriales bacterium]